MPARSLHSVRWRIVLPIAAGFVLLGLAAAALQTHYSLLSQAGKRGAWLSLLCAAWWLEQALFWSVVAATLIGLGALARSAASARPQKPPTATRAADPIPPDRLRAWRHRWASAAVTLVMLQLAGAADLWLATQPLAPPRNLPPPAPGRFRIAAIGGSAAAGYPYLRRHAFPALVGWRLQQLFPGREVLVDNLAQRGYTLENAYRDLHKLAVRPNVLLVYAGHNEFLMRYRLDRTPDERTRFQPSFLARALARRIDALREPPESVDNLQLRDVQRPLFDHPVANRAEWARRMRNFRNHLEATLRWCRRNDVLPILIIPACNESGFEPCRSYLPRGCAAAKQRRLREIFSGLEPGRAQSAAPLTHHRQLLSEARQICPTFAMTWFLLGRAHEADADFEHARHAYRQALAHDGFPWHATPFAAIYRDVAAEHQVPLLDAREILYPLAPRGILDEHLFHDVLHPSLTAHDALADAVVTELRSHALPEPADRWPADLKPNPLRQADYLRLTPQLWARVCEQVANSQLGVPPPHFESERRRRRAQRYARAAADLRRGGPPAKLPGIGFDATGANTESALSLQPSTR